MTDISFWEQIKERGRGGRGTRDRGERGRGERGRGERGEGKGDDIPILEPHDARGVCDVVGVKPSSTVAH